MNTALLHSIAYIISLVPAAEKRRNPFIESAAPIPCSRHTRPKAGRKNYPCHGNYSENEKEDPLP